LLAYAAMPGPDLQIVFTFPVSFTLGFSRLNRAKLRLPITRLNPGVNENQDLPSRIRKFAEDGHQ